MKKDKTEYGAGNPAHLQKVERMRKRIYGKMSAEQKMDIAADLYFSALALKQAHLEWQHPDWRASQIEKKAREWMMYAKS